MRPTRDDSRARRRVPALVFALLAAWLPAAGPGAPRAASLPAVPNAPSTARFT